jgi:hypothetical protein
MILRGDFDLTDKDGLKSLVEAAMKVRDLATDYHLYIHDKY